MNPFQIAWARHHTYLLFSKLFLHGLTADLIPYVAEIPQIAQNLPAKFDGDLSAAEHQQLFAFDIYPYESIFRDPQGLLGGRLTVQVAELYQQNNFSSGSEPGHVGEELAFLAYLCAAEANYLEVNAPDGFNHYAKIQKYFLATHLLHWLPALKAALGTTNHPFYAALGEVIFDLIADHADFLSIVPIPEVPDPPNAPLSRFLMDPQTNLKRIVHYLLTPPYCGFYLGRESIAGFARSINLPRGFGGREQMLLNLLRTAGQYELIPEIFTQFTITLSTWQQEYARQIALYPHLQPWIQPWQNRTAETMLALEKMKESAAHSLL